MIMLGFLKLVPWRKMLRTIIRVDFENSSFGYDLIFEIWISEDLGPAARGQSDF